MECVIIAAGRGSRISDMGESKPLISVGGKPIIEHVISSMTDAGIGRFHIVTGFNNELLQRDVGEMASKYNPDIRFLFNKQWEKANGISVLKAAAAVNGPFLLSMSDHIFAPDIISDLLRESIAPDEVILAVDSRTEDNKLVDMEDVTKVLEERGKIQDIGKTIPAFNCFDTGLFYCTASLFTAIEESIALGDDSLSGGMRLLAGHGKARTFNIGDRIWIDIDDRAGFDLASDLMSKNLI